MWEAGSWTHWQYFRYLGDIWWQFEPHDVTWCHNMSQFGVTICINLHNQQVGHKSATCDESIVGAKAHNKQGKAEEHLQKLLWLKAQLREQLRGSAKHKKMIKSHRVRSTQFWDELAPAWSRKMLKRWHHPLFVNFVLRDLWGRIVIPQDLWGSVRNSGSFLAKLAAQHSQKYTK